MGSCMDYVFRNAYPEDAADAEQRIREKYPLLLHQDETIKLACRDRAGQPAVGGPHEAVRVRQQPRRCDPARRVGAILCGSEPGAEGGQYWGSVCRFCLCELEEEVVRFL